MPEDQQGVRLGAPDTSLPDRLRERTTRSSRRGQYQPVGLRARMTRPEGSGGGQQQPAAAPEHPDHTWDLAMANAELAAVDVDAESAAVDVDEDDEDIL